MANERETGGPAFPRIYPNVDEPGMELRDYFAAKAIDAAFKFYDEGYCGNNGEKDEHASATIAAVAYEIADAMLKARNAK